MDTKKEGYEYNEETQGQTQNPFVSEAVSDPTPQDNAVNFIMADIPEAEKQVEDGYASTIPMQEVHFNEETSQSAPLEHVLPQTKEEPENMAFTKQEEAFQKEMHHNFQQNATSQSGPIPNSTHTQKSKHSKGYKTPLLICSCLLLGGVGGFAGSYLANQIGGSSSGKVVLQTVDRSDSDGNTVTNMSVKDVVANTANSVVEITTESATTDTFMQQYVTQGAGSGVIISADGYIVTNNHVVEGASKITVRTKSGEEYSATLIGRDSKTDLAVIKIDASGLSAAVLGNSADLAVGDTAIAIGNPLGELGGTVTEGIISALDREISIDGQTMTLLQTDTAINSGNSGGGLFNNAGELIGIVNAKSSGSTVEGLGFAIPIDTAKPVIESLISNGYVSGRPQLGVSIVNITSETSAFQSGVNELGVYIAKVTTDSAADKAGLKVRDRVISVDGEEITTSEEITKIVDSKKVGDTIKIVIDRDGKEQTISATLQEAVEDTSSDSSSSSNQQTPQSGSSRGFQQ